MNLQRINPQHDASKGTHHPRILCCECGAWFPLNSGFADLHGEPFRAYYCQDCADQSGETLPDAEYRA